MGGIRPGHGRARTSGAFTLVEILIVMVIIGVIAAIVIPNFVGVTRASAQGAFIADLRILADSAMVYAARTGRYLEDASSGVLPQDFDEYVEPGKWERRTPIGGVWDTELNSFEVIAAIGVHFNEEDDAKDDEYMLEVDATFDDGNLETGMFRKLADARFYYVIDD